MDEKIENESFADRETRVLRFWQKEQIFAKSLKQRESAPYFSIYDGPPFATGLPHYGHLMAGTIKDVVPRYKTMKGFYVPRRFGWDCHGLPIENEIEKNLGLSGAPSIEAFGIDKFNEECRKIVLRYTEQWQSTVDRMGRWVDFSKTWRTMDPTFMESVWWVFKQLYEKGLVYEGFKVMPFSTKLGTPLSNFEAAENYKEVDDPSVVVAFQSEKHPELSLLAWTTTPWTLISNLALTVGPDIDYIRIENTEGKQFILAEAAFERIIKDPTNWQVVERLKGSELKGLHYKPLFPYFEDHKEQGAFRVILGDFVETEGGTGIVHTAPAFGEADFLVCQKEGIAPVCPVDNNGLFTQQIKEFAGVHVKEADKTIIKQLKERARIYSHGTIRHRYPFCWRSDTPLIYKVLNTWFVEVEKIKYKLLIANEQIHWMPAHLKEGRFGKWLEGARDWAISRNRYWGTPIPLWRSEDGDIIAIGSVKELEELTGTKIQDLHRHFIDQLTFEKSGKIYKRIPEVFDCWFDAGSMPYAQNHYPFENKEFTEKTFPADFIAEGLDQTRGWFYTLTILAAALFDKPAFKNVVVNGIVLAEDGNKMSKRLKNYPEPEIVINKYGADAVRLYMLNSPVVKADDLRFSERGVETILRQILIPFWNAHVFFTTYAKIYEWRYEGPQKKPNAIIDRWILSQLNRLIRDVENGMNDYDLSRAVSPFVNFIDQLTNWYIRRSRRRFWSDEATQDRKEAFDTLYTVLLQLSKVAAPFIPFISEAIFHNLRTSEMDESVHLCDFPEYREHLIDDQLDEGMNAVQIAVSMGHSLRKEHKLKVRQPLPLIHIITPHESVRHFLNDQIDLLKEELNVKNAEFHTERQDFVQLSIKPNFRVLGKKVGRLLPVVQQHLLTLNQEALKTLMDAKSLVIHIEGQAIELTSDDVEVQRTVKEGMIAMNAGSLTVALDTTLTEELLIEGIARELVNKINTMRREADFSVTDRVKVSLDTTSRVLEAVKAHRDYIFNEVLATEINEHLVKGAISWDLNGEPCAIALERA